ncbi:hypothetical protein EV360DRAFT_31303, partial [Lentinula raphanica]
SDVIGSPRKLLELLEAVSEIDPVEGNYHGSYLTFRSRSGAIFALMCARSGFGLVMCDQGYWSRAIASNPATTARAYSLGGFSWFGIPFACGTALGLSARALTTQPDFPELSSTDISAGLAAVEAVDYILGTAGSVLMLLLIFLSVTSALSAEMIATSTLLSYDVYRHYIRPNATSKQIVTVSRILIVLWGIFSGCLASIQVFKSVGITLGWLFYFLGVATASGVFPIALTFLWKDLNREGAVSGSVFGMLIAVIVWLATAKAVGGEITVDTLSNQWASFAGNASAIISGGVLSIGLSLWRPADFDWEKTRNIAIVKEAGNDEDHRDGSRPSNDAMIDSVVKAEEGTDHIVENVSTNVLPHVLDLSQPELDIVDLAKSSRRYTLVFVLLATVITIIIPVPLGAAHYVFSPRFFAGVVGVMFVWIFFAAFLVVILPLVETRHALWRIFCLILRSRPGRLARNIPS